MPELPELQAHAERLAAALGGASLEGFRALSFTALKTATPSPDVAFGEALDTVDRRGKYLRLRFPSASFVVHLMQGGRLEPDPKQSAKPRGGLARWRFAADPPALLLTEMAKEKRAGVWIVAGDPEDQPPLAGLGPDATDLTESLLAERLAGTSMRVHGWLRHQGMVAGIGRRLSNEICHSARLSPFASTAKLTADDRGRLLEAIHHCIDESLAYERTRDSMSSSKDRPGSVHHRTGETCPACGDTVRAVSYSSYTVNYCATCQTAGKVLADNTTSRFLR